MTTKPDGGAPQHGSDHEKAQIYVGTGTDKRYPFPRLVGWMENWVAARPDAADVHLQAGITPCPKLPAVVQYPSDELDRLLSEANAVVIQGGAGGIMRARRHGVRPIVVPRYGSLGEAVDDHQATFVSWAAERSMVEHARSESDLHRALDRVLTDPAAYRFTPEPSPTEATVARFAARIEQLLRA